MTSEKKINAKEFFLDIFFPNRCPCCDRFIEWNRKVCEDCEVKLSEYETTPDDIISAYLYKGIVVDGIYALKFANGRNFAAWCAKIIAPSLDKNYDYIVPVPMGKKRRHERGYNQAEIYAAYLSDITSIPVKKNALYRISETKQHLLSEHERKINAESSYIIGKDSVPGGKDGVSGKRLYLADDVCTTGATLFACSKLLYAAGAKSVAAVVCAKTENISELTNGYRN
jgi:competence protein ComFC